MTNISKIQNSVKPLMMPSQELNLQDLDMHRFLNKESARLVMKILNDVMNTGVWMQEPGNAIATYLVGEQEWAGEMERMKAKKGEGVTGKNKRKKAQKKGNQKKSKKQKNAAPNEMGQEHH